jgi:hypothetical protein
MTIDEAIKFLEDDVYVLLLTESPDFMDALKLGIEALKREKHRRDTETYVKHPLLPGETEEVSVDEGLLPGEPKEK